ncbi:UNC93A [Bugula neritina]|uniref:UNC93A n=1 Tax=Bugula neritina TaxID=10212 RepID=A0A7J7IVM3_BUGNE|nr:UNC93A [Bugula neritina]
MLAGIYTSSACIAFIVVLFLQQLPSEVNRKSSCWNRLDPKELISTLRHLKDRRQLLLIPITIYVGMEQGFFISDYLQAYITCPLGKQWVGYVAICYGVVDAFSSAFFGKLAQFTGRVPIMVLGLLSHLSLAVALLYVNTSDLKTYVYFVIAGFWGMGDAIWSTNFSAFYGVLFKENSKAGFANFRMWQAVGPILSFGYQSQLCLPIKVYILIGTLIVGFAGYVTVEVLEKRKSITPS